MTSNNLDPTQDSVQDTTVPKRILLEAVTVELPKRRCLESTVTVTLGNRQERKTSERGRYREISWKPDEAWEITTGSVLKVSWRSRCPFKSSYKMEIDRNNILSIIRDDQSVTECDADGTTWHVFEDKGRKIMVKFNLDESRCKLALPAEGEEQPNFPPKRHTETRTELGAQCEQQSKPRSEPYPGPQPEIEDALQPKSQSEPQPERLPEQVKRGSEESRPGPALPAEREPQSPPKGHTDTQTEPQCCEEQSKPKPQSVPTSKAPPGTEDTIQSNSQPETHPDPPHEQIKHAVEEALKIKSIRDRLGASVTYLEGLLRIGDVVKDIHPVIGISIGLLSGAMKVLEMEDEFNQKIADLVISMSDIVIYVVDVEQFATIAKLKAVIGEANDLIRRAVEFFNKHKEHGVFKRAFSAFMGKEQDELEKLQTDFGRFRNIFDRGISVQTMATANNLSSHLEDLVKQFMKLVRANEDDKVLEDLNTRHQTRRLRCHDGTRKDLIVSIQCFAVSALNILWIFGYPGSGKSTLAMHVADLFRIQHRLGVIVEFNRNTGVNAVDLWKTFAYALAREYPECRKAIVSRLKSGALDLANATSRQIFNQLVAEPLRQLTAPGSSVPRDRLPVIIIDALDECGGLEGSSWKAREDILVCFADWAKLAPGVKLIVTSRAEQDILQTFKNTPHFPLEISTGMSVSETSTHDIELYLKHEFRRISTRNEIAGDWPSDKTIADLARRAQGVFIWATTILRFVDDVEPRNQLNTMLGGQFPAGNVYSLYRQILDASFPRTYKAERFTLVVGAIITLQKQFGPEELAQLLEIDGDGIRGVQKCLRTVLDDVDVMRFRHQSFVDFLTSAPVQVNDSPTNDPTACPERFHIHIAAAHGRVCESLFRVMNKGLRFNICQIPSSFMHNGTQHRRMYYHWPNYGTSNLTNVYVVSEDTIGRVLSYACRFWGFHLESTGPELNVGSVETFIHEHFLQWIESLSGLRSMIDAVPSLITLEQWLSSHHKQSSDLKMLVKDAMAFVRYFVDIIALSAPHVYISALAFAPKSSRIARLYAPKFKNIIRVSVGQPDEWPAGHAVIRGHSFVVNFVAFSPDGRRVVSCSTDRSIRISDMVTREIVAGPFKGHNGHVLCAVYSTDGKTVLSVSTDKTIRRWDAECGVVDGPVKHDTVTIRGIDECLYATFSHNLKRIASVQRKDTTSSSWKGACMISVHDVVTGQVVIGPIEAHEKRINCVTVSPDDACVASGSDDETICVWSTQTGELVTGPLKGNQGSVFSISYSHNGAFIASGGRDGTVGLWDVRGTPRQVWMYKVHTRWVGCVSFSNDDRRIVSGSSDRTVLVLDVKTGQVVAGPFQGHTSVVTSVAFSPDCKRIVSGSRGSVVRIWDVKGDTKSETLFDGHKGGIHCIALSKDSKRIVSGSQDWTIRIWDSESGELVGSPLKGHEDVVYTVAYSPDNQRVVSGSGDWTVRVWDVTGGEAVTVMVLHGHSSEVRSVAYSNNGKYIASASWDETNRIWNAKTGHCIHSLQVERSEYIRPSIAFSPDSKFIVSDSRIGFQIWDVETGNMTIESQVFGVYFVTFSHDGKLVATGSFNGDIHVWNATTGQLVLYPLKGHTDAVFSVAFSPDDNFIVSGSDDNTVQLWDTKIGRPLMGPFKGHTHRVCSVAFSHDGKVVVSASDDTTIRIWSVEKLQKSLYTNQPTVDRDGWAKGENGELLFWVPPHHRFCLHKPNNTRIIGPNETRLDFGNVRWGNDWTQCYTP